MYSYHVLHSVQILGTLGVAIVFGQVCCSEAILVPYAQVNSINNKDLTALKSRQRKFQSGLMSVFVKQAA